MEKLFFSLEKIEIKFLDFEEIFLSEGGEANGKKQFAWGVIRRWSHRLRWLRGMETNEGFLLFIQKKTREVCYAKKANIFICRCGRLRRFAASVQEGERLHRPFEQTAQIKIVNQPQK